MSLATFLRLGRVSNLPTVWSNTLAAVALAGAWPPDARLLPLLAATTLAYTGGMFLNDAFDREIDARERPERPIPSGEIGHVTVLAIGFAMLALAVALVAGVALGADGGGWRAVIAALALAATIVLYDLHHKGNPFGPLVMGLCRALVYAAVGLALLETPSPTLLLGAAVLTCYLVGLTWTAKQERSESITSLWPLVPLVSPLVYGTVAATLGAQVALVPCALLALWLLAALRRVRRGNPGDVGRAVGSMIAGIALVDAIFLAAAVGLGPALLGCAAFVLTLALQRRVPGT